MTLRCLKHLLKTYMCSHLTLFRKLAYCPINFMLELPAFLCSLNFCFLFCNFNVFLSQYSSKDTNFPKGSSTTHFYFNSSSFYEVLLKILLLRCFSLCTGISSASFCEKEMFRRWLEGQWIRWQDPIGMGFADRMSTCAEIGIFKECLSEAISWLVIFFSLMKLLILNYQCLIYSMPSGGRLALLIHSLCSPNNFSFHLIISISDSPNLNCRERKSAQSTFS